VLATAGDRNLGGFDFDNALMVHVNDCVVTAGGPDLLDGDLLEAELRDRCEHAKRRLSSLPEAPVTITAGGREYRIDVTRRTFEALTSALLRRTEEIVREVLDGAELNENGLTTALLVGGSTRMPMVAAMLERVTGVRADRSVHPDEAVALGAALEADRIVRRRGKGAPPSDHHVRRPMELIDVTSHSLGVVARSPVTGKQENVIVIPRNTGVPCAIRRTFRTVAENQREFLLVVTEGDDTDLRYVTVVGSARIPLEPHPESVPFDVVLSYDDQGMIHIEVLEGGSDRRLGELTIDRQANLDAQEVERARAAMRALTGR
jgi:molecular chaperone DnaK